LIKIYTRILVTKLDDMILFLKIQLINV